MAQKGKSQNTITGILLPMGLVCLFAFCSLALAVLGGSAYKGVQNAVDEGFSSAVTASYLRTKLSQHNTAGAVALRDEDGVQVLVLTVGSGEEAYETRIFWHEGALKEQYAFVGDTFTTDGGVVIAQVAQLSFALDEEAGLFTAVIEDENGVATRTALALSGGGAHG